MARKERNEPAAVRPVSPPGALGTTYGAVWPTKTSMRMKLTIQKYFSNVCITE